MEFPFFYSGLLNDNIYYSLEGYLFPDTYQIDKTWNIKTIFKTMLDKMDKELDNYIDRRGYLNRLSIILNRKYKNNPYYQYVANLKD